MADNAPDAAPAVAPPVTTPAAPAAEPIAAPAPEAVEAPAPAEPVAAPEPEAVVPPLETEPPEPVAPPFPSHDEFGWDDWDFDHGALPEPVQGWAQELMTRLGNKHTTALEDVKAQEARWENMYRALSRGDDDPQLTEARTTIESLQGQLKAQAEALETFEKKAQAIVDKGTERYVEWFAHTHPDVVKDEALFDTMADLSDKIGLEWHETIELQKLGSKAVEEAVKRTAAGKDTADTLELLTLKYGRAAQPSAKQEKEARAKKASEALASAPERPPVQPRAAPPDDAGGDLNAAIRNAVRSAVRGPKRR